MCRSIKTLRSVDHPATDDEVRAAALQFVRKVSGYRAPAARNADVFEAAVEEITAASQRLLDGLVPVGSRAKDPDAMAAHAAAHAAGQVHAHTAAREHAHTAAREHARANG